MIQLPWKISFLVFRIHQISWRLPPEMTLRRKTVKGWACYFYYQNPTSSFLYTVQHWLISNTCRWSSCLKSYVTSRTTRESQKRTLHIILGLKSGYRRSHSLICVLWHCFILEVPFWEEITRYVIFHNSFVLK